MKGLFLKKADLWVTKILSRPGIDNKTLEENKIKWLSSVAVTSMIFCITIAYHIIFPQLRILIYYGLFLTLLYFQGVVWPFIFTGYSVWRSFIDQSIAVMLTFICILLLGGIPTSGGLIFVGLAQVFLSLSFGEKKATFWIFIIYIITVILAGILHPLLSVPPEMTPAANVSLWVINLLWLSGFAMVFIMNFISQNIKIGHLESRRLKELDEAKTRFYTNISHEFRTPLTTILGMNDLIKDNPEKYLEEATWVIEKNSRILLHLVNQMLDLSRLETGTIPVNMIQADIVLYIRYLLELFNSTAQSKNIILSFSPDQDHLVMDYDEDKLMEIISNLVSNALKYSNPGGCVEVKCGLAEELPGNYEIRVKDNGKGIPRDKLPHIFERFYRVENLDVPAVQGSGLGLSLTNELIKLLGGTIKVESVYGEGTEFTISLPVTNNAPLVEQVEISGMKERISNYTAQYHNRNTITEKIETSHTLKPVLLIVEDSDDVISYLIVLFENDYKVYTASDGNEGLQKAIELVSDIILTDIMMPSMDGLEMLDRIKNDYRTSHIPVVMLTAKADIESRVNGLERGADAYIAKPFNREELSVLLKNLIEMRKKLRERYASAGNFSATDEKKYYLEDSFIKKIREIMEENLNDDQFDINKLCLAMSMSRTQLYRKFRTLTNKTVNEYIISFRLHKAREMLMNTDIRISEAAWRSGFKNLSHFSKAFFNEFGIRPSDIRN